MADLTKIARAALGSAAIVAIPASAGAATLDTEPNNSFAAAQPARRWDDVLAAQPQRRRLLAVPVEHRAQRAIHLVITAGRQMLCPFADHLDGDPILSRPSPLITPLRSLPLCLPGVTRAEAQPWTPFSLAGRRWSI